VSKLVKKALITVVVVGVWLAAIRLGTSSVISLETWERLSWLLCILIGAATWATLTSREADNVHR
jgi:hypothetical protein